MKKLFNFMMAIALGLATLSLSACNNDDEPEGGNDNNPSGSAYFDNIQGLWMMVKETNLKTNQTKDLDGRSYRYCYIYSEDGETLYGQAISYPSMSKGKKVEIEIDGDNILADGKVIGTIMQCGKEGSSQIELVVEWKANQEVFNPYSYDCVGYYWRDTWSKF